MDITNLRENYPKLLEVLKSRGYSEHRISIYRAEIERILELFAIGKAEDYAGIYSFYEQSRLKAYQLNEKRTIIRRTAEFDLLGRYPGDSRPKEDVPKKPKPYELLRTEFRAIIDSYKAFARLHGRAESTIIGESNITIAFLIFLQRMGIERLSDITEPAVIAHFVDANGTAVRRYSIKKKIEAVLKASSADYPECNRIADYLPAYRKRIKNIQFLTEAEVAKVKAVLADKNFEVSLRDKAIITIALYTGMRCSDIAALRFNSIDWNNDQINICQQKTGMPLSLPLSALVGNAIYDYIAEERPKSGCDHIFLGIGTRLEHMNGANVCALARRFMRAIGIRQNPGDRQGLHVFRHHFATTLLGNGVARPVITATMGHKDPASLETYLSADLPRLKKCAIGVENFEIQEKAFSQDIGYSRTPNTFTEDSVPQIRECAVGIEMFPVPGEVFA